MPSLTVRECAEDEVTISLGKVRSDKIREACTGTMMLLVRHDWLTWGVLGPWSGRRHASKRHNMAHAAVESLKAAGFDATLNCSKRKGT